MCGPGQLPHRARVELGVQLESHGAGSSRLFHNGIRVATRIELDRFPAELLHRDGRRLPVDGATGRGYAVEAVEEEPAARDELHGVDTGRRLERLNAPEQPGRIGAHVAHGGDALGEEVAQVETQLLAGASADHEEEMDVAIDQTGDEILTLGVDDAGPWRNRAFTGGTGAEDSIVPHQRDGIGYWTATGTIPEGRADDCCGRSDGRRRGTGRGRAPARGRQQTDGRDDG